MNYISNELISEILKFNDYVYSFYSINDNIVNSFILFLLDCRKHFEILYEEIR